MDQEGQTHLIRIVGIDEVVEELPLQTVQLFKREIWSLWRSSGSGYQRNSDTPTNGIRVGMLL